MAYDPNNIFARVIRGEVPCHRVHEDEHTLAFMDLMPQSEGHTLVLPKAPGEDLLAVPPEALAHTIRTVQRVARAVQRAFAPDGLFIAQFNGPAAGQTVFHLHFHVIPRWEGQPLKRHSREVEKPEVLAEHAARVRAALD
jgi:histidine triad (HIT) family protein